MEWKDINGFEGKYQISEDGRVRSIGRVVKNKCGTMTVNERILKPWIDTWGYKNVCLCNDGKCQSKKVHRLIAEAFVPPYAGEQVNHIDGDKLNNSIENLEWCTGSENMLHAYHNGLHSGATPVILVELGIQFPTIEEAARFVNGKHSGIRRCLTGRNKTHRGFHFVRAEDDDMTDCKHEFVYDELHREIVCQVCGYVLTADDKRELHRKAFELMEEEEGAD